MSLTTGNSRCDLLVRRVDARRQQNSPRFDLAIGAHCHQRSLGQADAPSYKRRIADVEAGQLGDHRLILVDRLQRALAGLCLIRRVRAVKLTARRDIPDCRRNVVLIGTRTDKTQWRAILCARSRISA